MPSATRQPITARLRRSNQRTRIEQLHHLSCDEALPHQLREVLAGACEALSMKDRRPPTWLLEQRESMREFLRGWDMAKEPGR